MQVLYDIGMVSHKEPFQRLVSQGMILGEVEYVAMQQPDGTFAQKDHSQGTPVRYCCTPLDLASLKCTTARA